MLNRIPEAQWSRLNEVIAETMGLHFPIERQVDLQRGMAEAARELDFEGTAACVEWLTSVPPTKAQIEVLASHLTVGETYFFREKKTFDALANNILPELIRVGRSRERRLRIWSAACCTGEEPYSLAILLHQCLPDLEDWNVTILATDINTRFLRKAAAGSYGQWSFRDVSDSLKKRYFKRTADGHYSIIPKIRKLVTFAHLNLVEDAYPSMATDTNAMDLIFCRNALMYFAPLQLRNIIGKLHHALIEGGWLAVSPSEASHALFPQFATMNFPGAILFKKGDALPRMEQQCAPVALGATVDFFMPESETKRAQLVLPAQPSLALPPDEAAPAELPASSHIIAESLYRQGRYEDAANTLLTAFVKQTPEPPALSLLTRALANQGKLAHALTWCDHWLATDKLDPAAHYLRAVVLLEQGELEPARWSLQRAVYLNPVFVLAHFALGNLARRRGKSTEADKHFSNTLRLLRGCEPHDLLDEADGLTVGRLAEIITSMTVLENAP